MMQKYDGYMQTFSGIKFYPDKIKKSDILLDDIIHALSNTCRYSGHSKEFYSVAEHCIVMADFFPEHKKLALFHDAAEAYMGDLPRPIKNLIPDYKKIELDLLNIILEMVGIQLTHANINLIERMDTYMLSHERRSPKIMQNRKLTWGDSIDTLNDSLYDFECYPPKVVENIFRDKIYGSLV